MTKSLDLPDLFRLSEALALGLTRRELDAVLAEGEVRWLRHGWYGRARSKGPVEQWERIQHDHRDALQLALRRHPDHVASHTSGAVVHDLAVSLSSETPVDLTATTTAPCSRREGGVVLHHSDSLQDEVTVVDGVPVTSLARTVVDYLRQRSLPTGLALLDDVLRRELVDLEEIRAVLDQQVRWVGRPKALAALHLADPTRESWGESFSFGRLHLLGVPIPLHQVNIYDLDGTWLARVDGLWPHRGVVGEADGLTKYFLRGCDDSRSTEEVVLGHLAHEQQRQRRVEDLGFSFVRWSVPEVRDQGIEVAGRIRTAFATAQPQQIKGYAEWDGQRYRLPFEVDRPAVDPETLRYRRPRLRRR